MTIVSRHALEALVSDKLLFLHLVRAIEDESGESLDSLREHLVTRRLASYVATAKEYHLVSEKDLRELEKVSRNEGEE